MLMLIYPIKNKKDKKTMTTLKKTNELARFIVANCVADKTTFNILGTTE
jgi:hypothetical protein